MKTDQAEETEYFEKTLQVLCESMNKKIYSNQINSVRYKQKILALASFLEFIKAGANVSVETQEDNKITFIIGLE